MKWPLFVLIASPLLSVAQARPYGHYDFNKVASVTRSANGQHLATINVVYLDQIVSDLYAHAGNYPPMFDSPEDRDRAELDVKLLSGILETVLKQPQPNLPLLLRSAEIDSVGHNLDVPNSGEKAVAAFTAYLKDSPDDGQATYLFGKFLSEADRVFEAIPLLEKAKSLGVPQATYTLGLTYLAAGYRQSALDNLEQYAKSAPEDTTVLKTIDAIRSGNVQVRPGSP